MDGTKRTPPNGPPSGPHSKEERNNRWFSQRRHQILKSNSQGLLNFYLKEVDDDLQNSKIQHLSPCATP